MGNMTCCKCGTKIETIPIHCGQDMIYNDETSKWECWMGPGCGYMNLDELLCAKCATECKT